MSAIQSLKQDQYMMCLQRGLHGASASQQRNSTVSLLVKAFTIKPVLVKAIPTSTNQERVTRDNRHRWQGLNSLSFTRLQHCSKQVHGEAPLDTSGLHNCCCAAQSPPNTVWSMMFHVLEAQDVPAYITTGAVTYCVLWSRERELVWCGHSPPGPSHLTWQSRPCHNPDGRIRP